MPTEERAPSRLQCLGFAAAMAALLLFVYGQSLQNNFVTFDDDTLVFNNPIVQSLTPAHIAYVFTHFDPELYIPLTFLSYLFDWMLSGGSPVFFHAVNLLLHFCNVLLIAWCVFLLSGKKRAAGIAAVLFALHPLNTEAVAWISARKDLLSTAFFLLSAIAYMQYRASKPRWYWISLLSFVLGLLSKVMILTLPFALLLIDLLKGRKADRAMFVEKIPYFLLSLLFGVIAVLGKQSNFEQVSPLIYLLVIPKNIVLTLQHFIVPASLSVLYPFNQAASITNPSVWIPFLVCAVILVASVMLMRRSRTALFGILFFFLTLIPAFTTIAKDGSLYITSDRYAYLPMIGLVFLIGCVLESIYSTSKKGTQQMLIFLAIVMIAFLGDISYQRSLVWQSTETLFADAVVKAPDSSLAHNKLGSQLFDAGKTRDAEAEFQRSLALKDNPRAHYNLGLVYLNRGDTQNALIENKKAIALDPTYAPAQVNLGYLLWQSGQTEEAIPHFRSAIENEQNNVDARIDLAVILQGLGKTEEARTLAEEVLGIDPQNTDAQALINQ